MILRKEQMAAFEDAAVDSRLVPAVVRRTKEMGLLQREDDAALARVRKMIGAARGYGIRSEDRFVQFVSYGLQFGDDWHKARAYQKILRDSTLTEEERMRRVHTEIAST